MTCEECVFSNNETKSCLLDKDCDEGVEWLEQHDRELSNMVIDNFVEKLLEIAPRNYAGALELGGSCNYLSALHIMKVAEQLKR